MDKMCGNRNQFEPTTYISPHSTTKANVKATEKEKEKARAKANIKAKAKAKATDGTHMPTKHQIMTTGVINHNYTIRINERVMELARAKQKVAPNHQKDTLSA